jgi:hypothetical protein
MSASKNVEKNEKHKDTLLKIIIIFRYEKHLGTGTISY